MTAWWGPGLPNNEKQGKKDEEATRISRDKCLRQGTTQNTAKGHTAQVERPCADPGIGERNERKGAKELTVSSQQGRPVVFPAESGKPTGKEGESEQEEKKPKPYPTETELKKVDSS